jgi:hypothetical protein
MTGSLIINVPENLAFEVLNGDLQPCTILTIFMIVYGTLCKIVESLLILSKF